jgi:hypothetical protein
VSQEGLEDRLSKTQEKAAGYEEKHKAAVSKVTELKRVIGEIFHSTGCTLPAGVDTEVTDGSLLVYLGMIEQRANEIIQAQAQAAMYEASTVAGDKPATVLGAGPAAPVGSAAVDILPPSTTEERHSDDESDEEVDDRPLTRDELQARTLRNLSKRDMRRRPRGKK